MDGSNLKFEMLSSAEERNHNKNSNSNSNSHMYNSINQDNFSSYFDGDYWRKRLTTVIPTIFPLRSSFTESSRPIIDTSITRRFLVPHQTVVLDHGVELSTILTLAYGLVLRAHADSLDEVVFGYVHYPERLTTTDGCHVTSFVQNITFDWNQTTFLSLINLQNDIAQLGSQQLFNVGNSAVPADIASLFRTVLCFRPNSTVETQLYDVEYDLAFEINVIDSEEIEVEVQFASKRVSEPEIQAFIDHFGVAIENISLNLTNPLSEVGLSSYQEQQRLTVEINPLYSPNTSLIKAESVLQLIESQARKTPQKIALQLDQDQFITYNQMDLLANDVGHILISHSIKLGDLVGIYMDKSCEMFLSILGIHKAGCGYIPLDPAHPSGRIQTILRTANIKIVLTSKEFKPHLESENYDGIAFLPIDIRDLSLAIKPNVCVSRGDTSHVLFTSGSTGVPKGVVITHGAVIESALASREIIGPLDGRALQCVNYTFDVSVWDWSCTLTGGGALCIVPEQELIDDLAGIANSLDITFLEVTPTVAALMSPEEVPSLATLILSGEMLTPEVRNKWGDAVTLMNAYGATEVSTNVTVMTRVTSSTEVSNIGRPFGLNVIYVLDERLRPVPLGCIGELFIGGPQVARGYLGAPEQTANVFVNDPFRPGATMYASGDLVRMSPVDYSITILGRRDTQIKMRGLRIEIGEIETVLKEASTEIANAVVIKVDSGNESLVAFLECSSSTGTDDVTIVQPDQHSVAALVATLKHAARQRLAPYMVPSTYVPVNRFPLSSSGKLDRKALAAFFYVHQDEIGDLRHNSEDSSSVEAPRDELQATLRSLSASILNLKEDMLGIEDDFFVVGGDSISAIRLASAARDVGIHLQTTDIIQNPTIVGMAGAARTAVLDAEFDDDDTPSVTLDKMGPEDLTLLGVDRNGLEALRKELLPKHGLLPMDVLDIYPCTALQTSFLVAGLFHDNAYIVKQIYDLPSGISSIRIREAFDTFINHPNGTIFRTIFVFDDRTSRYLQVVMRPSWKQMEWITIEVTTEAALEVAIQEYQLGHGCRKFEPGELMMRACMFELNGIPRALVWSSHHALADHWSANNADCDIADVYFQRTLPYRRSFKPMIRYLQNLDHAAGIHFWQNHLLGANPTDFPQSIPYSSRAVANTIVSRKIHTAHTPFTRKFGVTAASLATAAWSAVIAAHTSSQDVVFGQVVAGRNAPIKDIDCMAGCTINAVARRVVLKPEASILDTMLAIQQDQIEISKHEYIDLAELRAQGISAATLFKTQLNFTNLPGDERKSMDVGDLTGNSCLWTRRSGSYDGQDVPFTLTVVPVTTNDLYVEVVYNDEVISKAEVCVVLDHFECALHFMIDHPERLVADIELMNEHEMQLLVPSKKSTVLEVNVSDQNSFYLVDPRLRRVQNVSELIELQVERTPQRIALQFGQDAFLTYRQMNSLSNNLARKLIKRGVERGNLVALYMEKSIEMLLSILAVHKAGGGYVPLDPEHPVDRINSVLGLSKAAVVLTIKGLEPQLASMVGEAETSLIVVDFTELSADTKPNVDVTRDDICHVLFTSGSTGVPKGVILSHGSVIESVLGCRTVVGPFDGRVLQFSNYTFDFSVWDWACTLSSGGTLCILPKQQLINDLGGVARSFEITFLETTPTVIKLISPDEVPSLQTLLLSGEMLTPEARDTWADVVTLMNTYGPTEASTCITAMDRVTLSTDVSNIGRPFGQNVIYILDERLRPVPLGCVGELFVTGPQVARGYLGDPVQTAKAFINNPFRPGSIMYSSGDLARTSPVDHSLSHLGRRDTQIKIHGLRVEIGEIEAVLKGASTVVSNAAVIKVDNGQESLVAFLEYSSGTKAGDVAIVREDCEFVGTLVASLRLAARQRLPLYMVPSIYVPVNHLPLSSSGKLDRRALAAFFYAYQEEIRDLPLDSRHLSALPIPHDEVQATLRSLWTSILNLREDLLGIDDDFFTVGGDSISAIRLTSVARETGLSLPVIDIIRNPTIRKMAEIVRSGAPNNDYDGDETPNVTLDKMHPEDLTLLKLDKDELDSIRNDLLPNYGLSSSDVLDLYPSTALQTSFLLASMMVHDAYIVTMSWDLPPHTGIMKLRQAFEDFINKPNGMMLRTMFLFHPTSNKWLQVLIKPETRRMEWQTITVADEAELDLRVSEYEFSQTSQRFDDAELLTRGCIFELDGYARVLVWTLHHAIMDGWSMQNMKSDIEHIYANNPLIPRRSFKPMIKYLQRRDHTGGIEFWRKHLHNASQTPFLECRFNARRVTTDAIISRDLPGLDFSSFTRRYGIMPSTLVTCAWSIVMSVHSNCTDIVFGQVLSGRNAPIRDIGSMAGIMINTVPRRVLLNPKATVLETLQQIQSDQFEIIRHENISLAELQAEGIPVSTTFNTILNCWNRGFDAVIEHQRELAERHLFARPRKDGRGRIDYPLVMDVEIGFNDTISINTVHASEIISAAETHTMLDHFESALRFIIDHPEELAADVELINDQEMQLLIPPQKSTALETTVYKESSSYPHDYTFVQNVSQLIELQVERTPQRIALQFGRDVFLTYRQMDLLSNNLAQMLVKGGVERGSLVALYMDKSIEMFLSILAVHKAGGGYVPLDPEHPAERINTVLRLSKTAIVLTIKGLERQLISMISAAETSPVVVDFRELSADTKPNVVVTREDICHVLFTSGSTGVPKGVVLTHGSILESTLGSRNIIGRLDGRVLQFSNYTFDLSVWDWACTLSGGGTLCIVPKQEVIDDLGGIARSLNITFLQTTPTVALLTSPKEIPSLQILLLGGEVLTSEVRNTWADSATLINGYGPTEASTYVAAMKRVTSSTGLSNIGRPFGLNVTYVLDERLRPVPLGCAGELFVTGPQVARGYLYDPERTAKAFINNPFRPGSIMYATGDLVRMSPIDHSLSYIGRRDTQIKVRGLRVETGEIETVLKGVSTVIANAAVIKVDTGNESLVAFLEYPSDTETDGVIIVREDRHDIGNLVASLRHAVLQKLPSYMIPSIYVAVNHFPLSSSGKLDRRALAAFFSAHQEEIRDLQLDSGHLSALYVPHDEIQAALRSLWSSVLNLKEGLLGIDDDFFSVGGDSISAIRLASIARNAGLSLPVIDIIRNPNIRKMAEIVRSGAPNNDYDDDKTPTVTLDKMHPEDLTLLNLDQDELDSIRNDLLPNYGLSASDVLDLYPSTALQTSFLLAGLVVHDAYIVKMSWDLPPQTDVMKLRQAFEDFINKPNGMMLRTMFLFHPVSNKWLQALIQPEARRMEWQTITVADEAELDMRVSEYEFSQTGQRFDDAELLTRGCIFELDGHARVLAWTLHHAIMDGWSMQNMKSDIERIYSNNPLSPRRSFKPMIKYLQQLDHIGGVEFWRKHLHNASPTPFLEGHFNAPRVTTDAIIPRDLQGVKLSPLTRRFGIMPSTLITCAWSIVMSAHSNSTDVIFGQVLSGRNAPIRDIGSMAGIMINTVPRRVLLNPKATVLETLQQIQSDQFEIVRHENVPLAELQAGGIPISTMFNTILNCWTRGIDGVMEHHHELAERDLFAKPRKDGRGRINYPLVMDVELDVNDTISISIVHASDIISAAETHTILDHFESALRFMIDHPEELVVDIELINEQEMQVLIPPQKLTALETTVYETSSSHPHDYTLSFVQNISQLMEHQVERTPQRIALQFGQDVFLTYREMGLLSNNLAQKLVKGGIKRGGLVALYMDKSIEMFLSILAVHKAGGGYVPLDPEHPAERINTVIRLSNAATVLTTKQLQSQLASIVDEAETSLMVVDFTELSADTNPNIDVTRDDICHVLFTSGSTGIPKGVVLTHGSIIESALASQELIGSLDGRVLQCVSYTFDVSVWDWSCTLAGGGTLCIVPKQKLMDDLAGIANSLDITFLEVTPTVAALISPEEVPSLTTLILGGEMLTPEVRNKWGDAVTLMNAYGATEVSTNVTVMTRVTSSTEVSNIGKPFGPNIIYVLDEHLRPVPLGCIGELFIGGPQVARGYLGAPEQTTKVFINDPFRPGSIMYASGDLVRMSPVDHSLSYLGRRDTQIKIRGLRVEIGEIEAVLKGASTVISNAAVIKVDTGNERLIAFLEYPSDTETDGVIIVREDRHDIGNLVASLRRAVLQKLPSYMIPSIYVAVNHFPLSSSGKLDRRALAAFFSAHQEEIRDLQLDSGHLSALYVPHDEIQATLRSLWSSVLNLKEGLLGIDDDFFSVGGDSISAIRLASFARDAGLSLPVIAIIRNPTIRKMAEIVRSGAPNNYYDDDETPTVTLAKMYPQDLTLLNLDNDELAFIRNDLLPQYGLFASDVLDVYPSTAPQSSFLLGGMITHDAYIVTISWDLPPKTDALKLHEAFDNFINHPNGMMLRTVFLLHPVSNKWLQVLIRPQKKRMEWDVMTVADEQELGLRVFEYARGQGGRQFNEGELLTRACVFESDGYAKVLLWTLHHALVDHWTMEQMLSDINSVYRNDPLPPRRSFKPMIKYLQHLDHTGGVEFWRKHLHNASPTPFLEGRINARRVITDAIISRDLQGVDLNSLPRRFGIMPSTLVTCAYSIVMSVHSNSADIIFGQVLSGRNASIRNIGSMTGIMINTVPRRVLLSPKATVLETLQQIQSDQLEIIRHENISLTELQAEGIPVSTLFSTILNFRNKGFNKVTEHDELVDDSHLFAKPRTESRDRVDYPLALDIDLVSTDRLSIRAQYAHESIFEAEVRTFLDHFESAMRFIMVHPERLVADVELVNDQEMQLLVPPEKVTQPEPEVFDQNSRCLRDHLLSSVRSVSELIERQVERTPQRIALQFGQDVFLTYRQMDSLSNDLARQLIKSGVERGSLIALYMDKSIEMFLSILAVHKAGGGYVPLDPEHPADRINAVVRLSNPTIVLTIGELESQLASIIGEAETSLIVVDFRELSAVTKPKVDVARDDICHVLFTSGSTGVPKGVILSHESVIESALGCRSVVGPFDGRVLQFSNYTFDFSVWDWACTLSSGGTLCILPKQHMLDDLGGVARSFDITFLETTPTVIKLITPEGVPSLQTLVVGGEMLTPEGRATWADVVTLVNVYGPTEASTGVTILDRITSSTDVSNIGRPFGRNVIYVLDERLRPVPLGCVGELFVTGPQVARGYLADPVQTAKAFINNPFCPGSIMYSSGDLVRMSPVDHSLSYLGRRDTQIKIRGLRVEIGEIEAILKGASTLIANSAVIRVDTGNESLIAFLEYPSSMETGDVAIVREDQESIGTLVASLRRAAQQRLAPYMVPSVYVPLNRFPLSSSGKLDRKALTAFFYAHQEEIKNLRLDSELFTTLSSFEMPQDELQAMLRTLWASILNLKESLLSVDDDFFFVGGDSFSAIRLAGAAHAAGLSLAVTDIIRNPTIQKMARIVQSIIPGEDYDDDGIPTVTLDKMRSEDLTLLNPDKDALDLLRNDLLSKLCLCASDILDVYPATPTQANQLVSGMKLHGAYISTMSWDLPPETDVLQLQEVFDDFINHPNGMMLRTMFSWHPSLGKWLQLLLRPKRKRMGWTVITVTDETELNLRVFEYKQTVGSERFDDGELLTRACVYKLDGYARVLVWTLHHAVIDGWSMQNMKSDIEHIYANSPLLPRRSFKPMIKYLQSIDRISGVGFWKKLLHNAPPTLFPQSPSDAFPVTTDAVTFRDIDIDHGSLTRGFGIMLSTLITCAWAVVLSKRCSTTDVVFGQVLSGRNAPIRDVASMCGIMLNTVARRVVFDLNATVLETLRRIQSDQLDISKHEHIPLIELEAEGIPVSTTFNSILNFRNKPFNPVIGRGGCLVEDHLFANHRKGGRGRIEYPFSLDLDLRPSGMISGSFSTFGISEADICISLDYFESALQFMIDYPEKLTYELINGIANA